MRNPYTNTASPSRRAVLASAVALALATGIGASGTAAAQDDPVKVGFVYVGPISDHGWTHRHDVGRLAVEEEFGDAVETTYVESVPEGADAERVIRNLAQEWPRPDLHDVLRLHEPDGQGRQGLPRM